MDHIGFDAKKQNTEVLKDSQRTSFLISGVWRLKFQPPSLLLFSWGFCLMVARSSNMLTSTAVEKTDGGSLSYRWTQWNCGVKAGEMW